jgi:DNA-binding beta-propeller fold protein YncE
MSHDNHFDTLASTATRARADLATATLARPIPPIGAQVRRQSARRRSWWPRLLGSPVLAGLALAVFMLGVLVGINVIGGHRSTSDHFVASVSGGDQPVAVATDGRTVWVADQGRGRLLALDAKTLAPRWDVAVGPHPVAVTYGLGALWVVDSGGRHLLKIAPADGHLLGQSNTSLDPVGVVTTQDRVWVLSAGNATVDGYDPQTLLQDRAGLGLPGPTSAAPGAGVVWVASGGALHRVPTAGGDGTVFDVGGPVRLVAAGTSAVWVATDDGRLLTVDPASGQVLARTALAGAPTAIAAGGDGVAVATDDGTVSWIASTGAAPVVVARTGATVSSLVVSQHLLFGVGPVSGLLYRMEITP